VVKESQGRSPQREGPAPHVHIERALTPDGMARPEEFQCAVVREDALRPNRNRDQERLGEELAGRHPWWNNRVNLTRNRLQPPGLEVVLEPLNRTRPPPGAASAEVASSRENTGWLCRNSRVT